MTCLDKQKIIDLFNRNVRGKKPVLTGNEKHDGRAGHWLEKNMGLVPNGSNAPDLFGYEMKTATGSKTTFGDWSPDRAIFKARGVNGIKLERDNFFLLFGAPNPLKNNRLSWSGSVFPKYGEFSSVGTTMNEDSEGNIIIYYDFTKDTRQNKTEIIPQDLQLNYLLLAIWDRDSIKNKLESKFNQKGWFICRRDGSHTYTEICFGPPMNYDYWIKLVRQKIVYLDSGMYQGNNRPYQNWRASNAHWESLIVDCH